MALLRKYYNYKLPREHNHCLGIVRVTSRVEVDELLIHDYIPANSWMVERGLVPQPMTRKLGELAALFLERKYFTEPIMTKHREDAQFRNFDEWKKRGALVNTIDLNQMPLIEAEPSGGFEIVDGWGRLLPFSALLAMGMRFEPFQVFLATNQEFKFLDHGHSD